MLKPSFIFKDFLEITPEFLKSNNIKALLLDVDNTLTLAHKTKKLRDGAEAWFALMRKNDIKLMILSNAKTHRAKAFGDGIGLDVIGMSAKPLPFGYMKAIHRLNLTKEQIAMVGDQIFTDTLGANLVGIKSILVTDITPETALSFRIRRYFERKILKGVK